MNPLLVFRTGYMTHYDGPGAIFNGGDWVKKNHEGGEMWNFRPETGKFYGYVMTRHYAGVDLNKIDPSKTWIQNDELDNVDIVFMATKPTGGQVVIGWYRNATVFHKQYRGRISKPKDGRQKIDYLCQVDAENAVLLPEKLRSFAVPYAPVDGKGYPGQSNVWYPDQSRGNTRDYISKLSSYIASNRVASRSTTKSNSKNRGWANKFDELTITLIEKAAVDAAKKYFSQKGYTVESCEKDNCGYDLKATNSVGELLIEVKGHFGNVVQFELTPNEYAKLKLYKNTYRVCLLRNALSNTDIEVYKPHKRAERWSLVCINGEGRIELNERVAARASEI